MPSVSTGHRDVKGAMGYKGMTNRYDDRRLRGQLVWNVDVHVYLGRVCTKVLDLDQRGAIA